MSPKTVLIAVDWSVEAEKAFTWYVYNLHMSGSKVILLHATDNVKPKDETSLELKLLELQEVYETVLIRTKVDYSWLRGAVSHPGEYIVRVAQEKNVDMIVMGSRGLGKLRKTLTGGSVSAYVLEKTNIPVLICK